MTPADKPCSKCGVVKPLSDFYREKSGRDGYRSDCKACMAAHRKRKYDADPAAYIARVKQWQAENPERHRQNQKRRRERPEVKARERETYLLRKFGLTLADYDELLQLQGNACAICRRPAPEDGSLHVDHDHETGQVRGLLCFSCNQALGSLQDDIPTVRNALLYLTRARIRAVLPPDEATG